VRGSMPTSANPDTEIFLGDPDCSDPILPIRQTQDLRPCLGAHRASVLGRSCGKYIRGVEAILGSGPVRPKGLSVVCHLPESSLWNRVQS